MGMPGFVYRWFFFKHSVTSLRRNVLELVGIRPVRETIIGTVRPPIMGKGFRTSNRSATQPVMKTVRDAQTIASFQLRNSIKVT